MVNHSNLNPREVAAFLVRRYLHLDTVACIRSRCFTTIFLSLKKTSLVVKVVAARGFISLCEVFPAVACRRQQELQV